MAIMKIAVAGSLNMDLVARVENFPRPGETIFGTGFATECGGKGANQAMACARLGANVTMFGCVGDDAFGTALVKSLQAEGVATDSIRRAQNQASGCAIITISRDSQNSIVVISGANGTYSAHDIRESSAHLKGAGILLLQREIPEETNLAAARIVHEAGGTVILDPAPAGPLNPELMGYVDILTPNLTETETLLEACLEDPKDIAAAAKTLREKWMAIPVIKLGSRGVCWFSGDEPEWLAAIPVRAVDTVAAGDAFNAGLATALAEGIPFREAIPWALAAGAFCVTRHGAQKAMPTRSELATLLPRNSRVLRA